MPMEALRFRPGDTEKAESGEVMVAGEVDTTDEGRPRELRGIEMLEAISIRHRRLQTCRRY